MSVIPVSRWKFDETSGLILSDSVGSNNGSLVNMVGNEWTAGKWNNALQFDGVDERVQIADNVLLKPANLSISCWFKASSLNSGYILGKSDNNGYYLYVGSGVLQWQFFNNAGAPYVLSTFPITIGTWYHIVAYFNDSTKKLRLYVNGYYNNESITTYSINHDTCDFYINGIAYGGGGGGMFGITDEVRIYDGVLTDTEIYNLFAYNSLISLSPKSSSGIGAGLGGNQNKFNFNLTI